MQQKRFLMQPVVLVLMMLLQLQSKLRVRPSGIQLRQLIINLIR